MVPNIKKILFPTDLSQASRNAYGYAVAIAQKFGASITILHVMENAADEGTTALRDFLGEERWQQLQASHEQEARDILIGKKREGAMIREALGAFAERAGQELSDGTVKMDEIIVVRGSVVDEIISGSIEHNCDLIVMGFVARGKIEEAIMGSTSRRVLRSSNVPVMLVKAAEEN